MLDLRPFMTRQFAGFLLVGGTAAAAQWLSRFAFSQIFPYAGALVAAYGVGVVVAFELNRRFVFPAAGLAARTQFLRFAAVNVVSFAMVWVVSMLLGDLLLPKMLPLDWAQALGHGVGVLSPAAVNFLLHRNFTFRGPAA